MSRGARLIVFVCSGFVLFLVYLSGARGLPPFGHYKGPYGDVINQVAVFERHATDLVTAVNFDYRGFDTLGEEFILFISVVGVLTLLRHQREETRKKYEEFARSDHQPGRDAPVPSETVKVTTLALVGPLVLFGIYIVTHGQITPGGGFQGGVILATAPLAAARLFDHQSHGADADRIRAAQTRCAGRRSAVRGRTWAGEIGALHWFGNPAPPARQRR
jgi:multicomponent Na+:H+ antiporter subunit B